MSPSTLAALSAAWFRREAKAPFTGKPCKRPDATYRAIPLWSSKRERSTGSWPPKLHGKRPVCCNSWRGNRWPAQVSTLGRTAPISLPPPALCGTCWWMTLAPRGPSAAAAISTRLFEQEDAKGKPAYTCLGCHVVTMYKHRARTNSDASVPWQQPPIYRLISFLNENRTGRATLSQSAADITTETVREPALATKIVGLPTSLSQ